MPKTRREYLDDPTICPVCGSDMVTVDNNLECSATEILQMNHCDNCQSQWQDTYVLNDYTIIG